MMRSRALIRLRGVNTEVEAMGEEGRGGHIRTSSTKIT